MRLTTSIFLVFFLFIISISAFGLDLATLKKQIATLERELSQIEKTKKGTVLEIATLEKKINTQRAALALLAEEITQNKNEIARLTAEENTLRKNTAQMRRQTELGLFFLTENTGNISAKAVFAGADPSEQARLTELTARLNTKLSDKIKEYMEVSVRLAGLSAQLTTKTKQLEASSLQSQNLMKEYETSVTDKTRRLTLVKQDENAQKEYLEMLKAQEKELIKEIEKSYAHVVSPVNIPAGSFEAMRGKLPLPIVGVVISSFGTDVVEEAGVNFSRSGIRLRPTAGGSVKSVAPGNVVYAGELGRQNIIIIKHDSNYYTVYGNLDSFIVVPGTTVKQAEELGRINIDLSNNSAYLYFEVRKKEQALDPAKWLKL